MSANNKYLYGLAAGGLGVATWKTLFPWLTKDELRFMGAVLKTIMALAPVLRRRALLIDVFEEHAAKTPNKTFVIFEDKMYSYGFVNEMANRVASLASKWNLKIGDTVAIMISNEPAFIWTFLGLQKIGLVSALINFHMTSGPLAHSLNSSGAKALILGNGDQFLDAIEEIKSDLSKMAIYVQGKQTSDLPDGYLSFDEALQRSHPVPVCPSYRADIGIYDTQCYIYTSGTTGLPKPAIVNHIKGIMSRHIWTLINFKPEDRVYLVTPLYHSGALMMGLFNTINKGATVVLKRKFSAKEYFDDCRKHGVTVVQYIGELCRYLLHQPKRDLDGIHNIRVAFGNGLRPDVWKEFQARFKIPWIVEFFGATEGVGGFFNLANKTGAIGRYTPFVRKMTGTQLVKHDPLLDQPMRDKNNRCIPIRPGEEGLVIGQVPPDHTGFYKGPKEMDNKKIVRNAFKDGDKYFNFGDLVYWDKDYFLYFRDRTGDTFRWKGENVSTMEVGNVLSCLEFIRDVNVYGVQIPGHDGRAGMAAILLKEDAEVTSDILSNIYEHCHHNLPAYARPLFLRFVKEIPLTQTMKHRKVEYVKEGFDPNVIQEPLYFLDQKNRSYSPLDSVSYNTVLTSKL